MASILTIRNEIKDIKSKISDCKNNLIKLEKTLDKLYVLENEFSNKKDSFDYVIQNKNSGKFIDIDQQSGDYPYEVDKIIDAKNFTSYVNANDYKNKFPNRNWIIVRVTYDIKEV